MTDTRVIVALRGGELGDGQFVLPVVVVRRDRDVLALQSQGGNGSSVVFDIADGIVVSALLHDGDRVAVDHVRRVGPGFSLTSLTAEGPETGRYDRQERVFGRAGQRLLSGLHIGIVGAGGTGSAVVEQLTRLGVGRLTVVDDDVVTETNLTRIHQSETRDVGGPKCEIAGRLAADLGVHFGAVQGRVTDPRVARELTACDIVFGCTDDHAGRIVLSRMAPRYLQMLVDVGVTVDVIGGRVVGAPCRITVQEPGDLCLSCRGHIDLKVAAAELLPEEDRRARAEEGYVPGLGEPDPSVIAYTTLAASVAVSEMISRLFGFAGPPAADLLVDPVAGRWALLDRPGSASDGCTSPETIGSGDLDPFLGLAW